MNRVIQGNLLKLAAGFLILQTLIITLAPAVRARTMPGWHLTYLADGGAWYDDQPGMRPVIEPIIADLTPACAPRTRRKGVKA